MLVHNERNSSMQKGIGDNYHSLLLFISLPIGASHDEITYLDCSIYHLFIYKVLV